MKKTGKKIIFWIRNILFLFFILSLFFVLLYKYIPVQYTFHMFAKNVEQWSTGEKVHVSHQWKSLKEISPHFIQAVIASEDYLFLIHRGFDSGKSNLNLNKKPRALYLDNTTISQQTARNVFLFPAKNKFNKIPEAYFTLLIEFVWGKKRIMEVYLNSIEMGNAIFGVEAIAQKSFAISAKEPDMRQAAMIAACMINPTELNPAEPTAYLLKRQAKIMGIMENIPEIQWE
jgi:monofunctional biosynthetic peptidoglycan transglycosylase